MKKGKVYSFLAVSLAASMVITACSSSKPTAKVEEPTTVESTTVESAISGEISAESNDLSKETTTTDKEETTTVVAPTEEPLLYQEETNEVVSLTGKYLKKFKKLELIDYPIVNYLNNFHMGDTISVDVTLEGNGAFAGGLGTCEGANYDWNQQKYEMQETGVTTWHAVFTPSIDTFQLNIWWMADNCSEVGVKSIKVKKLKEGTFIGEENAPLAGAPLTGTYSKIFKNLGLIDYPIRNFCGNFNESDTIEVSVTLEGNGAFAGGLGTCEGTNYDWNQQKYEMQQVGETTWTAKFNKVSIDTFQLNIWWMSDVCTEVGVKDISVKILSKGYGMPSAGGNNGGGGSSFVAPSIPAGAKKLCTLSQIKTESDPETPNNCCGIDVYSYIDGLKEGDTVSVSIATTANSWYGGGLYSLADGWHHTEFSNERPQATVEGIVGPQGNCGFGVQLWWKDGGTNPDIYITSVKKIKDAPEPVKPEGYVCTLTKSMSECDDVQNADNSYVINPYDYIEDLQPGDYVSVTIDSKGTSYYGGPLYYLNDVENTKEEIIFSNDPTNGPAKVTVKGQVGENGANNFGVQLWWLDTACKVDIMVTEVKKIEVPSEEEEPTETTKDGFLCSLTNAKDTIEDETSVCVIDLAKFTNESFSIGDVVSITIEADCEDYYGGCLYHYNEADGWKATPFSNKCNESDGYPTATITGTLRADSAFGVQCWWINEAKKPLNIYVKEIKKLNEESSETPSEEPSTEEPSEVPSEEPSTEEPSTEESSTEETIGFEKTLGGKNVENKYHFNLLDYFTNNEISLGDWVKIFVKTSNDNNGGYCGSIIAADYSKADENGDMGKGSTQGDFHTDTNTSVEITVCVGDNPWAFIALWWNENDSNVDFDVEFTKVEQTADSTTDNDTDSDDIKEEVNITTPVEDTNDDMDTESDDENDASNEVTTDAEIITE